MTSIAIFSGSPDTYEEDDTFTHANVIVLNHDTAQDHNFHDQGDQDWVKFYGLNGQTYSIMASDLGSNCDIVLELYDTDGTTLIDDQDTIGDPQADELLEWKFTGDGVYYVKVKQWDPDDYGENTEYKLEVFRSIGPIAGFVEGVVKDAISGDPIGEARIKTSEYGSALSLPEGSYIMIHPPGTVTMTAEADGYAQQSISGFEIKESATVTQNFDLEPLPPKAMPWLMLLLGD